MLSKILSMILLFEIFLPLVACNRPPRIPEFLAEVPFAHPVDMAFNTQTGDVYIVSAADKVALFQGTELVAEIPTGDQELAQMAINSEESLLYVVNQYSRDITVIDGDEVVATLSEEGWEPEDVAISSSGEALVVGTRQISESKSQGEIMVIDGTEIVDFIPLGQTAPYRIVVDQVNDYLYIDIRGDLLVVKDQEVVAEFKMGFGSIKKMDINSKTGELYVLKRTPERQLTKFLKGKEVAVSPEIEGEGGSLANMIRNPVTDDLYVLDIVRYEVVVVRDMEVIARIDVELGCEKMAVDAITGNVYVANYMDDTVAVINGTQRLQTLDVGWYPYGIGVNPTNGWLYVSNTNDDTISVFGLP